VGAFYIIIATVFGGFNLPRGIKNAQKTSAENRYISFEDGKIPLPALKKAGCRT
jgi:hypothetical protein